MGNTPLYLANSLWKFEAGKKLTPDEGLGVQGFMNTLTIIKSRTNVAGQQLNLIYEQKLGFSNLLTNYNLLKEEKLVTGGGRSFGIQGCDVKFSQKDFRKKLKESDELRTTFRDLVYDTLEQYLSDEGDVDMEFEEDM